VGGLIALVGSSSVLAALLTGAIQSRLDKSRRESDRDERRRDERKELYVRFRTALDEFGGISVGDAIPDELLAKLMNTLVSTTVEMNMLAPDDVSIAAKKAFDRLSGWRNTAAVAYAAAKSDAEREAIVKAEWEARLEVEKVIAKVTALMRAELGQK
jgi:hypothetical protein